MRLQLTKLEVAQRQLETAVCLYFDDGDPVSIHTLAAAASEIINGVCKAAGSPVRTMRDRALDYIRPEYQDEVRRALSMSQNFFKHADRDSEGVLDFGSDEADARLLDAIVAFQKFTGTAPPILTTYRHYAALTWAKHMVKGDWLAQASPQQLQLCQSLSRKRFFEVWLDLEEAAASDA